MVTAKTCQDIRSELNAAFKQLEAKYGVTFVLGSMRYNADQIRAKIEINKKPTDGLTFEAAQFKQFAVTYGMKPEWLNQTVYVTTSSLLDIPANIIGLNRRSKKYPVIVKTINGKLYKMSARRVIDQMKAIKVGK